MPGHISSIPVSTDSYLTLSQASERGYGGYSTLRRRIAEGSLPAKRLGRRLLLRREDLEALLLPKAPGGEPPVDHGQADIDDITEWARKVASSIPPLSPERRARVAEILGGGAA